VEEEGKEEEKKKRRRSGLFDGPITNSEESYRLCLSVCDAETSTLRLHRSEIGCCPRVSNK